MMAEKITDEELLREIVWDGDDGYTTIEETIIEQTRWTVLIETIFKRLSDGKLFLCTWRKAATEMQEHELPEEAFECKAYPVEITKYRKVV